MIYLDSEETRYVTRFAISSGSDILPKGTSPTLFITVLKLENLLSIKLIMGRLKQKSDSLKDSIEKGFQKFQKISSR